MSINIEDLRNGKIKLEFGNPDQIAALDQAEEKKGKTPDGELRSFVVYFSIEGEEEVEVIARSAEEAEDLARKELDLIGSTTSFDIQVTHIEMLEE